LRKPLHDNLLTTRYKRSVFLRKNPLNLHGRVVRQSCNGLVCQLCLKCQKTDQFCLFHFYKKNAWTIWKMVVQSVHEQHVPHPQTGWCFFCVTNMSKTCQIWHICLLIFRIFSFKIRIVFTVYMKMCGTIIHGVYTWKAIQEFIDLNTWNVYQI